MVVSKSLVNTVKYYYDADDKMTKKVITPASGSAQTIYYENSEDNTVVKFNAGGKTITAHSKTDSFGRKVFDELQLGTGFVSRQFHYHAGVATEEHVDNNMLKSSPTTQLVSQIVLSGGRTISYEYDEEERITKIDDSVDGITTYTYDALGQLVTETVNGITTKFEYDNYGNILAKGVVDETGEIAEATKNTYTYGDENWKDLLTAYNGQSIAYDEQGNPISYLGHTLTWEKGRQLKSFEKIKDDGTKQVISYTYNANGIRTSKTVDGIKHTYTLDGTKILREEWNGNTLIPLYDNEETVCGILYNNEPYYFQKNLQGDIIGIVDKSSKVVANYSYDAWGKVTNITGTNFTIANINPYRYRGYYYDQEIGLYYLQSRYYNASVGRFILSDDVQFVAVYANSLKANLYTYCRNETTNYEDQDGYDAVWVTDMSGLSHTSLLLEDHKNNWQYFYWGSGMIPMPIWVPNFFLERINVRGIINKNKKTLTLSRLNNLLGKLSGKKKYNGTYDRYIYIKGNFYNSIKVFQKMKSSWINKYLPTYNVFSVNCVWMCLELLRQGNISWAKKIALNSIQYRAIGRKRFLIPSIVHWAMEVLF